LGIGAIGAQSLQIRQTCEKVRCAPDRPMGPFGPYRKPSSRMGITRAIRLALHQVGDPSSDKGIRPSKKTRNVAEKGHLSSKRARMAQEDVPLDREDRSCWRGPLPRPYLPRRRANQGFWRGVPPSRSTPSLLEASPAADQLTNGSDAAHLESERICFRNESTNAFGGRIQNEPTEILRVAPVGKCLWRWGYPRTWTPYTL
jgi:hypothetical protein